MVVQIPRINLLISGFNHIFPLYRNIVKYLTCHQNFVIKISILTKYYDFLASNHKTCSLI
jgi:hypothetical protein